MPPLIKLSQMASARLNNKQDPDFEKENFDLIYIINIIKFGIMSIDNKVNK